MKKAFSLILVALMTAAVASGCSQQTETPSSGGANSSSGGSESTQTAEVVELDLQTMTGDQYYFDQAIEVYNEKFPQYHVTPNYTVKDEYYDKVLTMFSGRAEFDIVAMNGIQYILDYSNKNAVMDLTDMIERSDIDTSKYGAIYQDVVEATGGKSYGIPYRSTAWALFYNKTIFENEGIDYPEQMTWSEYAELAKKLTKGEGANKQWGGYWYDDDCLTLAKQTGNTLLDDDLTPVRESLEFVNQLYNVDQSMMSLQEKTATQSYFITEFEKGNIAMFPNGDWCVSLLMRDKEDGKHDIDWDVAPYPVPDGVPAGTSYGGQIFIGIPQTSQKSEAAFHFIQWLTSEEGQSIIAENGILTGYIDDNVKEAFIEGSGHDSVGVFFEQSLLLDAPIDTRYPEIQNIWKEESNLYLLGEQDLDTTMANFENRRSDILK